MKRLLILVLALVTLAILSGFGVEGKRIVGTAPPNVPSLPCCECLGGTDAVLDLSTGQGGGTTDPLWTVTEIGGSTGVSFITPPVPGYVLVSGAKWIQPGARLPPNSGLHASTWKYRAVFNIPNNCVISSEVQLTDSKFASDNTSVVRLDGAQVFSCTNRFGDCFDIAGLDSAGGHHPAPFSLTVPSIPPGTHTLEVEVTNTAPSPTGLIWAAKLHGKCRTKATLP